VAQCCVAGGGLGVTRYRSREKAEEAKKAEDAAKAKAEKVAGDIGLLDTEKNYMNVVTKDGNSSRLDYIAN